MLFVLGLFFLTVRTRAILLQVTAFTIAHSITLALSMYGVFSLPSGLVEPLIAMSIAYVTIENVVTTDLKPWARPRVRVRAASRDGFRRRVVGVRLAAIRISDGPDWLQRGPVVAGYPTGWTVILHGRRKERDITV